jgi:hypothetical protein
MAGRIAYYGGIVTNGLVLNLDAAKKDSYPGIGTAWNDISGFRNNGTLINGPTFNSNNGGSIVFDGVNDYINGNILPINANTGSCLSLWLRTSNSSLQIISYFGSGINDGFRFQIQNNLFYTLGNVADYNTGVNISDNNWKNIVTSTSGSLALVYINGVLINSLNIGTMIGTVNSYKLGIYFDNQFPFSGNIAQTLIYNKTLTAAEVLQNYNALKSRYL